MLEDSIVAVLGEEGKAAPVTPASVGGGKLSSSAMGLIDMALKAAGQPDYASILARLDTISHENNTLKDAIAEAEAKVAALMAKATATPATVSGSLNAEAKVVMRKAKDVFDLPASAGRMFDFEVPTFVWNEAHAHVPAIDEDYVFRPVELFKALNALVRNKRAYFHGHTGTGKTTLWEQCAARLGWMFMRLNFDSEISRLDLIGRDVIGVEDGASVSRFVDGVLPQALAKPYIICFDEIDFVRPDVAYVMQRALEGDGLLITEDGGRMVHPHPLSRMVATGNTRGQGDEHGMYSGARPQSLALLDRFTVWAEIDYLPPDDRLALLRKRVPALADDMLRKVNSYVTEHTEAFKTAKVLQPISPRGYIALAEAIQVWEDHYPGPVGLKHAVNEVVLDRATTQDRAVLAGLAQRVFGIGFSA